MSYGFSQDVKEQVRQATNIVDLVGGYLELRRQGPNFVARCPWHDDRRPSLNVNPNRQSWRCWVCNIGGDIFDFVMQKERVEFPEALRILAERAGIKLEQRAHAPTAIPGSPDDKATLYQAMTWAERQFAECLNKSPAGQVARRYLLDRGISEESIERFKLGFSPDSWQWLLDRARGTPFTPEVLEACDLVGLSERTSGRFDRFRGRVIFPIHDLQGRPIALGGRVLPGDDSPAKYLNSRETRLFTKSENLYALDLARDTVVRERAIVVVEGYTDVVLAHQCGMANVVAVLGTAINSRHLRILRRFADTIYLVLDGDTAGQRRTNEVLELFVAEQMDLRIMTLPEGLDPADFFLQRGADAFRGMLAQAVDALEHRLRVSTQGVNMATDTHRANKALDEILTTIARAPRGAAALSAAGLFREQQILTRVAREFMLDEGDLRRRVRELRDQRGPTATREPDAEVTAIPTAPPIPLKSLAKDEVALLQMLLLHPELASATFERVRPDDVTTPPAKLLFNSLRFLYQQGEPLEFNHVLGELDDARLKSLLVELDEDARAKEEAAPVAPELLLETVCGRFYARQEERLRREAQAKLEQGKLDFQNQLETLQQLFLMEKNRRGLTAPTDG